MTPDAAFPAGNSHFGIQGWRHAFVFGLRDFEEHWSEDSWIPAFAGMTSTAFSLSFPRKRESIPPTRTRMRRHVARRAVDGRWMRAIAGGCPCTRPVRGQNEKLLIPRGGRGDCGGRGGGSGDRKGGRMRPDPVPPAPPVIWAARSGGALRCSAFRLRSDRRSAYRHNGAGDGQPRRAFRMTISIARSRIRVRIGGMDSRFRGNDGKKVVDVIPAKAGIHGFSDQCSSKSRKPNTNARSREWRRLAAGTAALVVADRAPRPHALAAARRYVCVPRVARPPRQSPRPLARERRPGARRAGAGSGWMTR